MELSVIIPIYNEEENIHPLHQRLTKVLNGLGTSYELIFVNDGSQDDSMELVQQLANKHTYIKYIDLSRNFGHQIAVMAGLDHAQGKATVIIDADLQDPPELIPEMVEKWKDGYEVVYAKRKSRKGESVLKKWTAKLFYRMLRKLTDFDIPVDVGDFRIIDQKIVEVLRNMPERSKYLRGQIAWVGFNQTYVTYNRDERHAGETGYSIKKMLDLAMNAVTGFSEAPLRLVTYMGIMVTIFSLLTMMYTLISRLLTDSYVEGWASLMVSILFLGGVQMIAIGILGEYIGRIYRDIRQRPLYIVKDTNF